MDVHWANTAISSYEEEIAFIFKKWGTREVEKFINVTEDFLKTLASGTIEGKPSKKGKFSVSVISKQTSLVYQIDKNTQQINFILFWNNLKSPKEFEKLLNF